MFQSAKSFWDTTVPLTPLTALSTKKIILFPSISLAGNSEILPYFTMLPMINIVINTSVIGGELDDICLVTFWIFFEDYTSVDRQVGNSPLRI